MLNEACAFRLDSLVEGTRQREPYEEEEQSEAIPEDEVRVWCCKTWKKSFSQIFNVFLEGGDTGTFLG